MSSNFRNSLFSATQVERKKRLFAKQRLEDLLLERGIDSLRPPKSALAHIDPAVPLMPVELFDDEAFEVRVSESYSDSKKRSIVFCLNCSGWVVTFSVTILSSQPGEKP